jgi:hypothetical protein
LLLPKRQANDNSSLSSFRFEALDVSQRKDREEEIGVPHFNTGRENLPVKSGAGKFRSFRF